MTSPADSIAPRPLPVVEELIPAPDAWETCRRFAEGAGVVFFDSARVRGNLGRYSFLVAEPIRTFEISSAEFGRDPFAEIQESLQQHPRQHIDGLPPFQGGAAGVLGYELGGCFERIPTAAKNEFQLPLLAVGIYDWVIAWDHAQNRAWIIVAGITHEQRRDQHCRDTIEKLKARLNRPVATAAIAEHRLPESELAAGHPIDGIPFVTSNFSREKYLSAVQSVIDYIRAGDIFQANLSQRLLAPQRSDALTLYDRLRTVNPATFSAFVSWNDWQLASASPERFLCLRDNVATTRPIKGTRRRGASPEAELFTGDELRESEKDLAENVMIVDLLRNDLSRVCRAGTIDVPELCEVEVYETVQHLVSEVRGELKPGHDGWDLFRAAFPGGSITGAPKIRAMEIIAEIEPTVRGPYCGSLFYLGCDGWMDSSILIRTFVIRSGWIQCNVGGGIVAQSEPASEYAETLHKAGGMMRALQSPTTPGQ